uniref:Olfactory receptor n=1 Tax=Leptobrachium leishanense TaxID=445787 RepID=A0A8C5PGQ1_9ANUR
ESLNNSPFTMDEELFSVFYASTLIGNVLIIITTTVNTQLHTPMYFFLSNLSFLEILYISVTIPKMLINVLSQKISYGACFAQLFLFISFGQCESFLLALMAFDRYAAICQPLRYMDIITQRLCFQLVFFTWFASFLNSTLHTGLASRLLFCASHEISHFFCDITPLLKISCMSTFINELVIFVAGVFVVLAPFLCILVSYVYIIIAILMISTSKGRQKTFSTCISHLAVVCIFYGTILLMYMRPASYSQDYNKIFAVIYTFITPLLNPFIYGLKNKDIKDSFKKVFRKTYLKTREISMYPSW